MRDLNAGNDKPLMREIKGKLHNQENTPCSWVGRLGAIIPILPQSKL